MNVTKIKSYAKINLALNITGKKISLHKIETIISFIDLHDLIFIKKIDNSNHKISFHGKFSKNIGKYNTVSKLLNILDKDKLLKNIKLQIKIKKNIPQKSGLGGGSMNAGNILNYLIKKNFIRINKRDVQKISNMVGSDVIFGVKSKSTILTSNNIIKNFFKCPKFYTLLVQPNFGCSTKKIYSGVKKITKPKFNNPKKNMFNSNYLSNQINALEKVAFSRYPKLQRIKIFLKKLNKPSFVRMTGSGSVIIAYYKSKKDCEMAKVQFRRKFNNYWCNISKTI
tara:strand:+ start:790 stop:1635 length:846 start_codon:yes stop_codon:yes gene_type:complete